MCYDRLATTATKGRNILSNVGLITKFVFFLSQRTNVTKEAIDLICKLKKDADLDINCFEELLISLHVTVVDILRDQNNKQVRKKIYLLAHALGIN